MDEEPVVYREEVLTVMMLLGDIRADLRQVVELLQEDDGADPATAVGVARGRLPGPAVSWADSVRERR